MKETMSFQVWDDCENYAWKVRRFKRRTFRKGPIRSPNARKGKGKGRKRLRPPMYSPKGRGKGNKGHYGNSQPPPHTDFSVQSSSDNSYLNSSYGPVVAKGTTMMNPNSQPDSPQTPSSQTWALQIQDYAYKGKGK